MCFRKINEISYDKKLWWENEFFHHSRHLFQNKNRPSYRKFRRVDDYAFDQSFNDFETFLNDQTWGHYRRRSQTIWRKNNEMTKKSLRSFKNIWSFIFDRAVNKSSYQNKKNPLAMISTKILKRNLDFQFWKKNLNKIETFIIFVLRKNQTKKNQLYKTKKNFKKNA